MYLEYKANKNYNKKRGKQNEKKTRNIHTFSSNRNWNT